MGTSRRAKRIRFSKSAEPVPDPFETLPDDLLICILSKLSSSSSSPADLVNALLVCKRFNRLGLNPVVLSRASSAVFSIRATSWSDSAHRFLKQCVLAGSVEACFFLGMIRFYCFGSRGGGASLMAKAAIKKHAPALYSLAIIQFNGSGGAKADKDLRAGVALCARAAYLGHVDARRELGHCIQDGYGVRRSIADGRRLLVQANALELAAVLPPAALFSVQKRLKFHSLNHRQPVPVPNPALVPVLGPSPVQADTGPIPVPVPVPGPSSGGSSQCNCLASGLECALMSDFGCNVPLQKPHPANRFLIEWFGLKLGSIEAGLSLCSYPGCGRAETRPHEFRRCSACGGVKYCSRGCQAHDWKLRHKVQCSPVVGQPAVDVMVVDS